MAVTVCPRGEGLRQAPPAASVTEQEEEQVVAGPAQRNGPGIRLARRLRAVVRR